MVYTFSSVALRDSKSVSFGSVGSGPTSGTKFQKKALIVRLRLFLPHCYSNFLKFAFHLVINQRKAGLSPPCYIYSHVIAHHIQPLVHILSLRVIFCTCHLLTLLRLSGTAEKLAVYYVSISGWWVS